ncbi:MAG: hypothetical protein HY553_21400 [Elusimicrobia bacterium]|nr:hypothetical protein [Elusimicrobiota bacterium]
MNRKGQVGPGLALAVAAAATVAAGAVARWPGPTRPASPQASPFASPAPSGTAALPAEPGLARPPLSSFSPNGAPETASLHGDLADLLGRVGREADLIGDEASIPAMKHLAGLARATREAIRKALPPIRCLAKDASFDLENVARIWATEPFGLQRALVEVRRQLEDPQEGLIPRLERAAAYLEDGECLASLADDRLSEGEPLRRGVECHRRVGSGLAIARRVADELPGLWPVVWSVWEPAAPRLAAIAADRRHPDRIPAGRLLAFGNGRVGWYRLHPPQAHAALEAAAPAEERAEEFGRRARLRRDELSKALDAFADAWTNQQPVAAASRRARDAWLKLDQSAQSWSASGPRRRDGEAEGGRLFLQAYLDLMDSRRLLLGVDSSVSSRRLP